MGALRLVKNEPMKGHAKICMCDPCSKAKAEAIFERISDTSRTVPKNRDQTIPVRAHWRKSVNHLNKQPKVKDYLQQLLVKLRREAREEAK